jgi:hypothetical protein
MVTADVQFRFAANAAADQYRRPPAYMTYHTVAKIDIPALKRHQTIERAVETRTADDFAVLQDLPKGQRQYGQSFPLIPTFDALSYFRIDYNVGHRDVLAHVTTYAPITFAASHASMPGIAAVATTLRNYYAHYADDSSAVRAHLIMEPLVALTHNNRSSFYIHDLYIDTATNLPLQVTYTGPDELEFTVDYTTVETHWLVSHVHYARTFFAPLHIGKTHLTADVSFDTFSFPEFPADQKLFSAAPGLPPPVNPTHSKSTLIPSQPGS